MKNEKRILRRKSLTLKASPKFFRQLFLSPKKSFMTFNANFLRPDQKLGATFGERGADLPLNVASKAENRDFRLP
jgi:hypothetical protein